MGGAETETTVKRNRQALDSIAFRPRVLRDVSQMDSRRNPFLGQKVRLPILLAPIGGLESIVQGGAATAAQAAAEFGVPQMLSSVCQPGLEDRGARRTISRVPALRAGDDAWVDDYVRRAKDNGYCAFCLTVDVAHYSRRERDIIGRFVKPWRARAVEGAAFQVGLSVGPREAIQGRQASRSSSKASPPPRTPRSPWSTAWRSSTSRTMADGSWITAWAARPCCLKS